MFSFNSKQESKRVVFHMYIVIKGFAVAFLTGVAVSLLMHSLFFEDGDTKG